MHDLKKTLEEVRHHTGEDEQPEEDEGSGGMELPGSDLQGSGGCAYDDLFGPGGLQSPRTIPEVDLS